MSQPAAPEVDLLPPDGLTGELRHKVEEFIEEFERALLVFAGALVIIPVNSLDAVGVGMFATVFAIQMLRHRRVPVPT